MKTFRELIAWELEQDRKQKRSSSGSAEASNKLTDTMMRKLKHLNANTTGNVFTSNFRAVM